ncbi:MULTISPECIES: acyltransferase family protein [Clostridia]|uniref:acyltransferase family protein n=1 Tax=Clostridia TaxID=186801 RepID=UPI0012B40889|nr:acyltransferase family protein [Clostridium sp. WB02_MRS01]MBW4845172.1 acyltransferase [Lachnospiraceae bacterium]MSS09950.1 acyltransferase [Clostridium sp. WB02_MRS01]
MEEKYFRNKITWFTFLYSFLVIWVHSYNAVLFLGSTKLAYKTDWMERFLGGTVAQIAVPGFFLISSYLFFRGFTLDRLMVKWNSRIRSVMVPYIVWNFLYYLGYVIGSRIPVLSDVIGKGVVPFTFTMAAESVLNYTYNYVFWYLNQLIQLILLAPLIYIIVKRKEIGCLFLAGILAAIYMGGMLPFLNLDALFYYSFGAFAAIHGKKIVEGSWNIKYLEAGAAVIMAAFFLHWVDFPGDIKGEMAASDVCFRLLIPVGLWLLVPERYLIEAKEWMKQNFFLYATHFAIVRLINKTGALLLPTVSAVPFGLFLLMPLFCVFFSYQISRFFRRFLPSLWCLLNGGR